MASFQTWCNSDDELKDMITNYVLVRQKKWKIFRDRHPGSYVFDKFSAVSVAVAPEFNNHIVFYCWLRNPDWKKFSIYQQMKLIITELDLVIQDTGLSNKSVTLVQDLELFTRDHFDSITAYSAKVITEILCSMPVNIGVVLVINPPDFISEYTELFAPLDFHIVEMAKDLESFLPKQCLPSDLGGASECPNREEMRDIFMRRLGQFGPKLAYEEVALDNEQFIRYSKPDATPGKKKPITKKGNKKDIEEAEEGNAVKEEGNPKVEVAAKENG